MKAVVVCCLPQALLFFSAVVSQSSATVPKSKNLYILTLLSYPDPSNESSLQPSIANGDDVIPGARRAAQEINSRTDILTDYNLELISADDGCDVSGKAVASLLKTLYYEGKQIVGIVGPGCSGAAAAVGSLTGKPEIALVNVHLGSSVELADRALYPYSFGILPATSNGIDAAVALFKRNRWNRVAVLYNEGMLVDYTNFLLFQEKMKGTTDVSFVGAASPTYLPLKAVKGTYVRVIVAFLRGETLSRTLCLAYHMGMTYPRYQWLLYGSYPTNRASSFSYGGKLYSCTERDMLLAKDQMLQSQDGQWTQYKDTVKFTRLDRADVLNTTCTKIYNKDCVAAFDAVWALAAALNSSIVPLKASGFDLADYTFGKEKYTKIIQDQMFRLNFSGLDGPTIIFNPLDGYISSVITYIFKITTYEVVANYTRADGIQIDTTVALFVNGHFSEEHVLASRPLAAVVIALAIIGALSVLVIHVVNTAYRNHKAIKASSSRLNHFAYAGCYLVLFATLVYTVTETFPVSIGSKSVLCNVFPWSLMVGLTLVFVTVTAKTFRLYHIFRSSQNLRSSYHTAMSDQVLALVILILAGVVVGFCAAWSAYDPYVRTVQKELEPSGDSLKIVAREFCDCKYPVYWTGSFVAYESIFVIVLVYLAFGTRAIKKKEFQTRGIVVLAYLLTLTSVVGGALYWITVIIDAGIDTSFGLLAFLLIVTVYLCIALLFTPPIVPVIDDLLHPNRRQRSTNRLTIRTLIKMETSSSQL